MRFHSEFSSVPLGLFFLEPRRVNELEKIQVERAAQSQTAELETRRRQLIFTVLSV